MKRKTFIIIMGAVFASLMALVLFVEGLPSLFSSVMAFPFEQIGAGLRALSLMGNVGNGLALALCAAAAMLPVLLALRHKGAKAFRGENTALCCTGVIVFIALFTMAEPARFLSSFPYVTAQFLPVVKGIMGCTVWSFVVLWMVLRLVRMFRTGDTAKLSAYLRTALYALCLLFDAVIALSCGSALLDGITSAGKNMDGVMAVLRFITSALPYALDIVITFSLISLIDVYIAKDEENTVKTADTLSRRCCLALGVTAASTAVLNVIQLLLSRYISDISVNVDIPVVSLAFILLILLLSRSVVENRKLQNDNDLFI